MTILYDNNDKQKTRRVGLQRPNHPNSRPYLLGLPLFQRPAH